MTLATDEQLPRVRARRSPVAAYLASFIFLGMALSVAGPALPFLREHAGVGIGASGFVLAGQSFGYILGSLAAGRKYDRGHGHRLLVGAGMVAVAAAVGLTAVNELWMVVGVFMIIGFSAAALDVGGNTLAVWSQPTERVGSTLNALHLCFGLGALATPLIVSRFAQVERRPAVGRGRHGSRPGNGRGVAAQDGSAGAPRAGAPPRGRRASVAPCIRAALRVLLHVRRSRGGIRRLGDDICRRDPSGR